MDDTQIKFFKGWLIFFIISTICGLIAGLVTGAILGFILGVAGTDIEIIKLAGGAAGFIVGLPISFVCYRWSIRRFILPQVLVESVHTSERSPGIVTGPE
ncbi:MAG: hypothetical protein JSW23_01630 [Planctomycetota bacterium]|nr:MAG: hypothetical protein JSW23_01630 [Planctomycetota bacterium]